MRYRRLTSAVLWLALDILGSANARAVFFYPASTAELVLAITTANINNEDDVIDLQCRTFSLMTVDNTTLEGENGLPVIGSDNGHGLTIMNGTIERSSSAELNFIDFRIIQTAPLSTLRIELLTIKNGLSMEGKGGGSGGGILNFGSLELVQSELEGNGAIFGAGLLNKGEVTRIDSCTFANNYSFSATNGNAQGDKGGAISNSGTIELIENSTFANNTSARGGALDNLGNIAIIANTTISGNGLDQGIAGGIYNQGEISSLTSTIIANNIAQGKPDIIDEGTIGKFTYSLIGAADPEFGSTIGYENHNFVGTTVSPLDPKLGPLADNGGSTRTFALEDDSPAIDNGANALELDFDQRGKGFARETGCFTDIGSFENQNIMNDSDNDQWPDECDNCPEVYNPHQEDTLKDGIGDACRLPVAIPLLPTGAPGLPTPPILSPVPDVLPPSSPVMPLPINTDQGPSSSLPADIAKPRANENLKESPAETEKNDKKTSGCTTAGSTPGLMSLLVLLLCSFLRNYQRKSQARSVQRQH